MKKFVSVLLCMVMALSLCTVAFAADCDHMGNNWKYVSNGNGTHNVVCADCDSTVSENVDCYYDENDVCYTCKAAKPAACDHMNNNWLYTPVTATTHSVTCKDCNEVVSASVECVFTDGKCICGNVEPACDHMANDWTYTPVTATTHSVTCNVCKEVVTASTECVFTDGKCVCGNTEPADCKHEGSQKLVANKDGKTHNAYCPECGELMSENIPHTYQYNSKGEYVGKGGDYCLCGAKKPTSHKTSNSTSNTTTNTTVTKSPKTGDMGVVLYAATALLSLSGTAVVINKRKNVK